MSNDHSSTSLTLVAGQTTEDLKPVVVGSGVWFGVFWNLRRATDGGWWHTKKTGRMTYTLCFCRLQTPDGIKANVIFAGVFKLMFGRTGQKPSLPNDNGEPRSPKTSTHGAEK